MNRKSKLLIVDDEFVVRDSLGKWFAEEGYDVALAESAAQALNHMAQGEFDLALIDVRMPGTTGVDLQQKMREVNPEMLVIIMTGYASVDTAVTALKNGAYDYLSKPFDPEDVSHTIKNALSHKRAERENAQLHEAVHRATKPHGMIGQSAPMRRVFEAIATVGPTEATVLIYGESGTGKELVARAVHSASPRRCNPLIAIHCGALTDSLLESELFGHEKGAFTGAQYRRKGSFEIAEGGSIFLDEIGDISLKTQTDMLRVLQEREIVRVGNSHPIPVDFRCISATNKDLHVLVDEGSFRFDLYYRLNVFQIHLPPLRERKEDIPLLVDYFIRKFSSSMKKDISGIAAEATALLSRYDWPGNVRELENAVERAMVLARTPELREQDFSLKADAPLSPARTLEEMERSHILAVMGQCRGNQTLAAQWLDIDRVTLHNKLKKYGWKKVAAVSL